MSTNKMFEDLFNPQIAVEESASGPSMMFKPHAAQAENKQYTAVVRFVPNIKDPASSIISKRTCWLEHPITKEGRSIDTLSNEGQKCPIETMFWSLRNSNNPADKELSKKFSSRKDYYALVQIINDQNNPDNIGKILVWKFGVKVFEKIQAEDKPEIGEPRNPFAPETGRCFFVKTKVVSGFNNYDECKFVDLKEPCALRYYNEEGQITGMVDRSDPNKLIEYLENNAPSLEEFKYQPWDTDTREFVESVLKAYSSPQGASMPYIPKTEDSSPVVPEVSDSFKFNEASKDDNDELEDLFDQIGSGAQSKPATKSKTKNVGNIGVEDILQGHFPT